MAVGLVSPGAEAVGVIATTVPTWSGEKGGVAVPPVDGTGTGIGSSHARAATPSIRNAIKGRMFLLIGTSSG